VDADNELLHQIRIASPCSASWEEMRGDERARFCEQCRLNVYNLLAMSAAEAAALVRQKEGRLCVRYYARRDGTMLTRDCPVGFGAARRVLLAQVGTIAGVFTLMFGSVPLLSGERRQAIRNSWLGQMEPFKSFFEWLDPTPLVPMGRICLPVTRSMAPVSAAMGHPSRGPQSAAHRDSRRTRYTHRRGRWRRCHDQA
jgi:hypothetical protein